MFGNNADTIAGDEVLEGTYWYETEFDEATREICEELTAIRDMILANSVSDIICRVSWGMGKILVTGKGRNHLIRVWATLQSLQAGVSSPLISHYHSMKASVTLKMGYGLE